MQASFFPQDNSPSGSSFNTKRKRSSWCVEDYEYDQNKQMRVRSPGFERRTTFPLSHGANGHPGHPTHSAGQRSDGSEGDADMDMDGDSDMPISMPVPMHFGGMGVGMAQGQNQIILNDDAPRQEPERQQHNYSYAASGSGGFGFGPGAEEDEEEEMEKGDYDASYPTTLYPSLTPHTNPNHFSNLPTTLRPKSPLSAQPFSTSLRAPGGVQAGGAGGIVNGFSYGGGGGGGGMMAQAQNSPFAMPVTGVTGTGTTTAGLLQPTIHAPLPDGANEVDRARAQHGPQCQSIPKLVLSQYPDPATGKQSMWAMCRDCGAVERSS